jgi:hypothetical protein
MVAPFLPLILCKAKETCIDGQELAERGLTRVPAVSREDFEIRTSFGRVAKSMQGETEKRLMASLSPGKRSV